VENCASPAALLAVHIRLNLFMCPHSHSHIPIIRKYHRSVRKHVLSIARLQAVIWALVRILHPGKHPNRLDGLQPTSSIKQLAENSIQSIVSVLQTDVTAHGMKASVIHFHLLETTANQRLLQQGFPQVRGQRPLHEMRWNAEVRCSYGIAGNHALVPVKDSPCTRNSYTARRFCLSSSATFLCTWSTNGFCS
jgi:hypothetical protein